MMKDPVSVVGVVLSSLSLQNSEKSDNEGNILHNIPFVMSEAFLSLNNSRHLA